MREEEFTPEALKLPDDFAAASIMPAKPRQRRHDRFIKVPVEWERRLQSAHLAATYRVALHLLYLSFKDRRQTIRLANGVLALQGVTPGQKWRAIAELERLGLVNVNRRPRKSPDVNLLFPEGNG